MATRPKLPPKMPDGKPWPPETKAWWGRWSDLTPAQWDELLVAALIHGALWREGANASLASELRKRTALLEHSGRRDASTSVPKPPKRSDLKLVGDDVQA